MSAARLRLDRAIAIVDGLLAQHGERIEEMLNSGSTGSSYDFEVDCYEDMLVVKFALEDAKVSA